MFVDSSEIPPGLCGSYDVILIVSKGGDVGGRSLSFPLKLPHNESKSQQGRPNVVLLQQSAVGPCHWRSHLQAGEIEAPPPAASKKAGTISSSSDRTNIAGLGDLVPSAIKSQQSKVSTSFCS